LPTTAVTQRRKAQEAGFDEHLAEPASAELLQAILGRHLGE
jgi:CheY-like chemotaxis protein